MLYALEVNPPQKCIFLVEGEFDLFAIEACLKHLGKEWVGCVATLGANLSFKNLYKLKNKHIVILYDNDEAGYLGTKKAIELVKQHPDLNIKIYNTPIDLRPWDDKDPDETIKRIGVNLYSLWIKQLIDKYFTNKLNDAAYIEEFKEEIPVEKYSLYNKHLDTVTHGLPEGITVIAGDPKAGKSGFALSLARRYIQDKKSKVLYCTNEISKKQCWARLMSAPLDMDWVELEAEPIKMYEMAKTYSSHIRIEFMPTLEKIESMSHFYNIIFIDYIQLVPGEGNDKERIDRAMALFSKIASATTKRIVCLSSLSQEAYTGGKYIGQAKYKGSGNIEYGLQLGLRLYKVIEGNNIYTNVQVDYNTRGQNTASKYITYPHLNTFIGVEE